MGLSSIKEIFVPKSKIFYTLFEEVASTANSMSNLLLQFVMEENAGNRTLLLKKLEDAEHKNDHTTHTIFISLGKYFITPFDREDIHYLAKALDDISDYIFASAKKIDVYKINPAIDGGIKKMAELIQLGTMQVQKAVMELHNVKNLTIIKKAILEINTAENKADELYDMLTDDLFKTVSDIKEIIRKKDIYHSLEIATDKCEDAANAIESIIVKYT